MLGVSFQFSYRVVEFSNLLLEHCELLLHVLLSNTHTVIPLMPHFTFSKQYPLHLRGGVYVSFA